MSKNSFQILSSAYHMKKNPEVVANLMQNEFAKGNISYPRSWREVRILNEQKVNRSVKTVIKTNLVAEFKKTTDIFILSDRLLLSTPASMIEDFKKASSRIEAVRKTDNMKLVDKIEKYVRTLYSIENMREMNPPVKIRDLRVDTLKDIQR